MVSVQPVLSVRDLVVEFASPEGPMRAVDGVSFDVQPEEVLGIVGESGSGKSVSMLAVMGLLPPGRARVFGEIWFRGQNLLQMPTAERGGGVGRGWAGRDQLRGIRGRHLTMVFQDPMTSLNPVKRIGGQIGEIIRLHQPKLSRAEVRRRVIDLLALVGVPNPARRCQQYPHEYSGGMRQRAMIAMAMANEPELMIADEPTTALDVTIQAQVLEVLADVRARTGASMVLITHDLGLVAEVADRVGVMYGGRMLEQSPVEELFRRPRHPYTIGLLASLPRLDADVEELYSIPGQPPGLHTRPSGCVFHPRCARRRERDTCLIDVPALRSVAPCHQAACHFWAES